MVSLAPRIDWKLRYLDLAECPREPGPLSENHVTLPVVSQEQMDVLRATVEGLYVQPVAVICTVDGVEIHFAESDDAALMRLAVPPLHHSMN